MEFSRSLNYDSPGIPKTKPLYSTVACMYDPSGKFNLFTHGKVTGGNPYSVITLCIATENTSIPFLDSLEEEHEVSVSIKYKSSDRARTSAREVGGLRILI